MSLFWFLIVQIKAESPFSTLCRRSRIRAHSSVRRRERRGRGREEKGEGRGEKQREEERMKEDLVERERETDVCGGWVNREKCFCLVWICGLDDCL